MNILKTIRDGMHAGAPDGDAPAASSADASQPLTDRYDRLKERDAVAELGQLNQVELTTIDTFERSHRDRPAVLNKLRYLRQREPLPGYDALEPHAIGDALSGVDRTTVKATREYERKLGNRPAALKAIARALHQLGGRPAAAPGDSTAPAPEQPLVVGNGLPIKVKSGLDA